MTTVPTPIPTTARLSPIASRKEETSPSRTPSKDGTMPTVGGRSRENGKPVKPQKVNKMLEIWLTALLLNTNSGRF